MGNAISHRALRPGKEIAWLVGAGLLLAWVLRLPFGQWEWSGWDRPWVIGFAVRLYRTSLFELEPRIGNFFVQVLSHRGGFELFPNFAWVGVSTLFKIPITATNMQIMYATLETTTLGLLFVLLKRLCDWRTALLTVFTLAVLPANLWSGLYPMTVEWIFFLQVLGFLLLAVAWNRQAWPLGLASGMCFLAITLCSRTFLVEYAALTLVIGYLVWKDRRRISVLGWVWVPMTLGVLFQCFLFYHWIIRVNIKWGILQYIVEHVERRPDPGEIFLSLKELVLMNGILLPAGLLGVVLWQVVRLRRLAALEGFLLLYGGLFFVPAVLTQARIDLAPLYFVPWSVLMAIQLNKVWVRWPRVAAVCVVAALGWTIAWGLHTVRDVRWRLPTAILQWAGFPEGQLQAARVLKTMNDDGYMKATGYWIREYVPRTDKVGLYGGYWQLWNLEVYSGKSIARQKHELGFGTKDWQPDPPELQVSPGEQAFHWAVLVHPYEGQHYWSLVVTEGTYQAHRAFIEQELKYHLVGKILEDGRPVISIYSDRQVGPYRIERQVAEQGFDRKYANLQALAFDAFVGYGMNY